MRQGKKERGVELFKRFKGIRYTSGMDEEVYKNEAIKAKKGILCEVEKY